MKIYRLSTENNRNRYAVDYAYELNDGRTGNVQIDDMQTPYWYNANLDDDDKTDILNAIDLSLPLLK